MANEQPKPHSIIRTIVFFALWFAVSSGTVMLLALAMNSGAPDPKFHSYAWIHIEGQYHVAWWGFSVMAAFLVAIILGGIDLFMLKAKMLKKLAWFFPTPPIRDARGEQPTFEESLKQLSNIIKENDDNARSGVKIWMEDVIVPRYANNVQGFAYFGAAVLIFVIGLRGIRFIPAEYPAAIILGLGLEFALLFVLAVITYYTPEPKVPPPPPLTGISIAPETADALKEYNDKLKRVADNLSKTIGTIP